MKLLFWVISFLVLNGANAIEWESADNYEMMWHEWYTYEPSNKNCLFYDAMDDEIHLGNPVAYIRLSDYEMNVSHWMPLPPKPG